MIATLVNVEDMRSATLHAGIDWTFETYGEYLAAVVRRGTAINFGGYVGHTAVRLWVMGDDAYERPATADEIARMATVVVDADARRGIGILQRPLALPSRRRRPPGALGRRHAWRRSKRCGRRSTPHGWGLIHVAPGENYEWVYELQRELRAPVTWSAILAYPTGAVSKAPWRTSSRAIAPGSPPAPTSTRRSPAVR